MSQVNGPNASAGTHSVFGAFSASGSPQLALAMLQMDLAKTNKDSALGGIKEIESQQAQKKAYADALNQARDAKASKYYTNTWGANDCIPDGLKKMAKEAGISLPSNKDCGLTGPNQKADENKANAAWDKVIAQLQTKLDTVGANIQTQMVQLQDFMGQYNSYMQGANTAISQSNQVLAGLAKGQ
ncbi:MAG: USH1C-binding protein 1 [Desulfovibrio sp.]|nr:USH1C-binding protein 1 [Desulfovibrio sp.]